MELLEKIDTQLMTLLAKKGTLELGKPAFDARKPMLFEESPFQLVHYLFYSVLSAQKVSPYDCFKHKFGYYHADIPFFSVASKKQFISLFEAHLEAEPVNGKAYALFFKHQMIKPKRERLQRVVYGKGTDPFTWIDKQEEELILGHYYGVSSLLLERYLGITNERFLLDLLDHYTFLFMHPHTLTFDIQPLLSEKFILAHTQSENERILVKDYLHHWYQTAGKQHIQLVNYTEPDFYELQQYAYLLNEHQQQRAKENILLLFEKELAASQTLPRVTQLETLTQLKEKAEEILSW